MLQLSVLLAVDIRAFTVLGPVVAAEELGGPRALGTILIGQALGLLAGAVVGLRYRPRRMLLVATLAMLLTPAKLVALGFPLALPLIVAAAFVAGFGLEIFVLLWNTTMQQEIPSDKLSRVYSYDALGSFALLPLGLAVAGPIAELVGVRATLWGAAAIAVAVTLPVFAVRDVRTLERREPATPTP
jgi:MFS family permease